MERLFATVLRYRWLTIWVGMLLVGGGILALRSINVDAFPDITPVRVEIDTDAPGLASEEVEKLVTHPLEVAMQGIPRATKITSKSKFAISVVTVYFEDNVDVYWARDQVFQQLSGIPMPPGITPTLGANDTGTGQIFIYALKSDRRSNMELRTLQDWVVTPALKAVPGVADNLSFGGEVKQYQVLIDPDKLRSYGIALDDVTAAIGKNNTNTGGNYLQHGGLQYIVRGIGLVQSIEDIRNIVVTARNGIPIYVGNVATVQLGPEVRQGSVTEDGQGEVVAGITILRLGSNTSDVIQRVKERLKTLAKDLPPDVRVETLYDQSVLIKHSITTVRDALIAGEILVVIILFVLLSNFRAAIVAGLAVPLCMLAAVVMAFAIAPALCALLFASGHGERPNKLVQWLRGRYEKSLERSVQHPLWIGAIWLIVTVMSLWLFTLTGSEFLPSLDENNVRIRATLPASISLPEATRIALQLERILTKNPNVVHAISYVGRATLGGDPESVSNCEISLPLKPPSEWVGAHSKAQLEDQLRQAVSQVPGVEFEFSQELEMRNDELISGFNTPITVFVQGDDIDVMVRKANQIAGILRGVRGATDVAVEQVSGVDDLDIVPDRAAIARYGINVSDVMDVVQSAVGGTAASTFYEGEKQFAIQVRLQPQYRNNAEAIRNLLVTSSSGQKIPLSELATVDVHQGLGEIGRLNARRQVAVLADVSGRSVGSIVNEARQKVDAQVHLGQGYSIEWAGMTEELNHAISTLEWAIPASLVLIFILIYACFDSLRDSLVVMTTIPLAIVGGTILLILLGLPLSVPAIIGYIANFGTEVQNGTIMVSFINRWRSHGLTAHDAAVRGATERLRAEILSALIGVLALIPFLVASGVGATVERPLAAVVIGGIALSRPLAWFLLPTLYVWLDRNGRTRTITLSDPIRPLP
ncbi:MAG: efflux RND transporter permease subunit [Chloroflexi bacterium]|nr:efflux RND transporter permease subunit [Chloroflexota bacterium]